MEKRYLASKYLHFHLPNCFYIYDKSSKDSIKKSYKKRTCVPIELSNIKYDEKYGQFVYKTLVLKQYILKQYDMDLMPRDMDNLLLYF